MSEDELHDATSSVKKAKKHLREVKKELHRQYLNNNRIRFWVLDIGIVLIILFNLGALTLTNVMVMKDIPKNDTIVFYEANPFQADRNNFTTNTATRDYFLSFIRQTYIWAIIITAYVYYRRTTFNDVGYMWLCFIVILYLTATSMDFLNDLGFWIGKKLYGG